MTYVPHPNTSLVSDVEALHALNIFDWFQILPATVSEELVETVFADAFEHLPYDEICRRCADKVDLEYERLAERYASLFRPDNRFRGVLEIETIVRMLLEGEVANGHCSGGRNYFTFSPDRSIMPCHRLVGEAQFKVADFGGAPGDDAVAPWRLGINETPVCRDCSIRYICGGGCKQENFVGTGSINLPDAEKCRFQFRLVHCAVQAIADSDSDFRARRRDVLSDLFVSCGRPTLASGRRHDPPPHSLTHLTPLELTVD
jgi:radical SAM protein with 4Fe4S-binding SPASM domain